MVYEVLPDSLLGFDFDPLQVPVVAYSPFDTGINGSAVIEVTKEEDLNIILALHGPDTAWPTPRKENGVDNIVENIVVTVTKTTGEPAPNQPVEIEAFWISGSGGHGHISAPPKDQMGVLSVSLPVPLLPKEGKGMVTAQTDEDGKIYLSYATPKFGGRIGLTATLQTATGQSATKQMIARVPGLKELQAGKYYELIGAPDNHKGTNDPCRFPPGSYHYSNHWGIPNLTEAVKEIAAGFDSLYPGTKLRINDMSLKNGGLFDFKNNWSPPHKSHRTGTNADIGFKAIGPDGGCKEDLNRRDLRQRIFKATQIDPYKESDHFHIYVK